MNETLPIAGCMNGLIYTYAASNSPTTFLTL